MTTKRSIRVREYDASGNGDINKVRIEVYYNVGGANYFTGRSEARGYYISIQPLKVGKNFTSFTGFTGVKELVEEANRFSQKKLESIAESISEETFYKLLAWVEARGTIVDESTMLSWLCGSRDKAQK